MWPPHPDDPQFEKKFENLKIQLVRSQQIHTCKHRACLQWDYKTMSWKCKRRAPFPLSETDYVDKRGNWNPKCEDAFINNFVPEILVYARCNHDTKLLANGDVTMKVAWYISKYMTKQQQKCSNPSALLAEGLAFHYLEDKYVNDLRK